MGLALRDVHFVYQPGTPVSREVLRGVDLEIREGEILCLLGRAGSGKSTLLLVAAGLLRPSRGQVLLDGKPVEKASDLLALREAVGVLLQSSEDQLFAETVERDVSFSLRNLDLPYHELRLRTERALWEAGLDPALYSELSPFGLSQGEMRRVALAGVLIRRTRLLLLDEPFSGLDGKGRRDLLRLLKELREDGAGILVITHDWEEVEMLADRAAVLSSGCILLEGDKRRVLSGAEDLLSAGLQPPPRAELLRRLRRTFPDLPAYTGDPRETVEALARHLPGGGAC